MPGAERTDPVPSSPGREKILITGGQGFLGAWAARQLLAERVPFALLDLRRDDAILEQVLPRDALAGLERHLGDIADPAFVRRAVEESGATRVIHLAGLQIPTCKADPLLGARVNVLGTLSVLEAARLSGGRVRSVAYASSAAVAGPAADYLGKPGGPIADDAPHRPRTHYGVFKTANEGNARVYFLDHGVRSVGLRPLACYGVGREVGITSGPTKAIKAAILGRPYEIRFTGDTAFSLAADVAATFIACARAEPQGAPALNLPGEISTVAEFIRLLEAQLPAARGRVTASGGAIPVAHDFSGAGLEALLGRGRVPRTPLDEGIRLTREHLAALHREGRLHDRDLAT